MTMEEEREIKDNEGVRDRVCREFFAKASYRKLVTDSIDFGFMIFEFFTKGTPDILMQNVRK